MIPQAQATKTFDFDFATYSHPNTRLSIPAAVLFNDQWAALCTMQGAAVLCVYQNLALINPPLPLGPYPLALGLFHMLPPEYTIHQIMTYTILDLSLHPLDPI